VVAAEQKQWAEVKRAPLWAKGATITHYHAVGRVHRPWHDRERPAPFAEMLHAAKCTVDPAGILNPGVLIDRSELPWNRAMRLPFASPLP